MNIFKHSFLYRILMSIKTYYQYSFYYRIGCYFSRINKYSHVHKSYGKHINKEAVSHHATMTWKTVMFMTTPFRYLKSIALHSKVGSFMHSFNKDAKAHLLYGILLMVTTYAIGLNLATFFKGELDFVYSGVLAISIITLFIYMKVEKYSRYSSLHKLLTTIFD